MATRPCSVPEQTDMRDPETGIQILPLRMPEGRRAFGERPGRAAALECDRPASPCGAPEDARDLAAADPDARPGFDPDAPADWLLDRQATSVWVFDIDRGRIVWANAQALRTWRADSLGELSSRMMGKDM